MRANESCERKLMAEVIIYTRQFCGFCTAAKDLLRRKNAAFRELDATFDSGLRKEMVAKSNGGSTFPQIFIDNTHVGGCDDLFELESSGKLSDLLGA